ncbi:MAG: NB-ARC domain-containing protein [Aulosira sp. DedQUE10]|nr:NB-ARC domain-containing protein [Aulosira sp. DedQUE10]
MVIFVGRGEELQKLHKLLQQNQQVTIAAIAGMGGVGKTELALQYAIQYRDNYQGGICWLLPKSGDIGVQIVQFARTQLDLNPPSDFDLPAQVQYCWRRWREGDVLLVLDDVADYQKVKPYLSSLSSRFKILITTRQHLGCIAELSLDVLQPEAALELLKSIIGVERVEQENHRTPQIALQLCEWLGYLPLGLELVGRYLARKQDLSLAEMLRRLEKKRLEQPALGKPEADMTAQRGVLAAFELSWQELQDSDKQLGCLLSLFATAPILWNLVEQCLPQEDGEDLEEIRDDKLLKLHLLQWKGEGVYQLHPLLQEFFQYKLTALEQAEELKHSFCKVIVAVAKKIPDYPTFEQITDVNLAKLYYLQGRYTQAEPLYLQALEIYEPRLGVNHPNTVKFRENLANLRAQLSSEQ